MVPPLNQENGNDEKTGGGIQTDLGLIEHAASQAEALQVLLSMAPHPQRNHQEEAGLREGRPLALLETPAAPEQHAAGFPPPTSDVYPEPSAARLRSGGRHAAAPPPYLDRRGARFVVFSAIGGFVFLMGLGLQAVLTGRWHVLPTVSYLIQAVASVEASFLLNRWLTWRDRGTPFWLAFARFNVQKVVTIGLNLALYAGLLRLGMNYLVANVVLTAVFTVVNYVAGDRLVFLPNRMRHAEPAAPAVPTLMRDHPAPEVSIIVPCKDSGSTIRAAVESLLHQDYPSINKITLVGSRGDTTWSAMAGLMDPRLSIWELETPPGMRDANFKRHAAIMRTSGDLIALVDSDIVLPYDWLSRAVATLTESDVSCLAGGMKSIHDSFWGRYTDSTWIGAKTPRIAESYTVTSTNFGVGGRKPPISANTLFTRELYDHCPIDPSWSHGSYEDYEWFWRATKAGYGIRVCRDLFGWHHHRRGLRALAKEYRRSSRGCAYFIRAHPDSPLAKRRLRQAIVLPLAAIAGAAGAAAAVAEGYGTAVAAFVLACAAVIAVHQVVRSRNLESVAYPAVGLGLGLVFTAGLVVNLVRPSATPAFLAQAPEPQELKKPGWLRRLWHPLVVILLVQAGLSLSLVWSNTAFGDEADYLWAGRLEWAHWLHGVKIPAFANLSEGQQFWPVIGAAANAAGGLVAARILSLCFMLLATVVLYMIVVRLFTSRVAIMASALWAFNEPVLRLAFATGDGLACLFVLSSAWLVVRSVGSRRRGELIALAAASMALADVTAFSFVVYDIALIAFAFLVWQPVLGARMAAWCTGWLALAAGVITAGIMTFFHLWATALQSTANRTAGLGYGVFAIAKDVWSFEGVVFGVAVAGTILGYVTRDSRRHLLAVCALTGWLNPAFQAHLGTTWSMDKHMVAGVAFVAIPAGYAFSYVTLPKIRPFTVGVLSAAVLAIPAVTGLWYSHNTYHYWPNVSRLIPAIRGADRGTAGPILVDSSSRLSVFLVDYYLMRGNDWQQIQAIAGQSPSLSAGRYAVIVAGFNASSLNDPGIPEAALHGTRSLTSEILHLAGNDRLVKAITDSHQYRFYAILPYQTDNQKDSSGVFVVWKRVAR
jgi:putative flippase GtrA/GT2 family glycosyltransferase